MKVSLDLCIVVCVCGGEIMHREINHFVGYFAPPLCYGFCSTSGFVISLYAVPKSNAFSCF